MKVSPRKTPRQERSRVTVEAILQAGAQVFRDAGFQAASTNQIATVAGVSIGSLYQYFPDKVAIAAALSAQIEDAWAESFQDAAHKLHDAPIPDAVRALIAGFLDGYERDARLVHVLLSIPPDVGAPFVPCAPPMVLQTVRALLAHRRNELPDVDLEVAPALLARAVDAVAFGALVDGVPRQRLEDELVRLCLGYLRFPAPRKTKEGG